MFKIKSSVIQAVVSAMAKSVKDSGIGDRNVYIKNIGNDIVSFYFTSLDLSAEKRISAEVKGDFFAATSMKELAIKVAALPSQEEIEVNFIRKGNGQFLQLVWGSNGRRSEMTVTVLNEETEFLEVPLPEEKVLWGPKVLSHLVNKFKGFTVKSSSNDARNSPVLSGIMISQNTSGHCILRATDRHNSVTFISRDYKWLEKDVIIDTSYLHGISNLIPSDCEVEVGINEQASLVIFQTPDTTCVCRVLNGKYPEIDKIYDHNVECKYIFDRPELMELCSRVLKIVDTGAKLVKFETRKNLVFAVVPNVLEQQLGATVEGLKWSFAVNAEKLLECVKFFEAEDEITLYIKDPGNKPITIGSDEEPDIQMATTPYKVNGINAGNKSKVMV
ncbi:DNA polymerase III subunit beta [Paenibacillus glucanolyticus]|uniref:Uncharacterized protein n=1 Tax=Paenibacillus glucanolyticus TaxID=59843 RepID=A0A168EX50_9BACL|nr:hypothetical protein [Paenibacillus glucanolyticus]KZS44907.1 hypothetical protein AWU65_02680 [Paenibacillus glucanolyticus]OMF65544.1 hypothetical protein BK142_30500 [Paenibacillus glucanolyticus]